MIGSCNILTLGHATDLFLVYKFNDKRKYHKEYSIIAQEVYKENFRNTLFVGKNIYVELKNGDPFNYIEIPYWCERVLGVSVEGPGRKLKPLKNDQDLNMLVKPKHKTCGCDKCDCGGLCESVGGLVATTQAVIINGQTYYETTWLKYCPDGTVYEYRSIPTTKYIFDSGAYDDSYDISYETGETDSSVVTYTTSRLLCKLDTEKCGCPSQTKNNEELFFRNCGCFVSNLSPSRIHRNNCYDRCSMWAGNYTISECGTKIGITNLERFEHNQWLVLSCQTNGVDIDSEITIPDYFTQCLFAGMDHHRKKFNDSFDPTEKWDSYYRYVDEQNKLIVSLNRISFEFIQGLPTVARW